MKNIIILFSLLLLTGCNATTRMSGYVDPDYRGSFLAQKVVVTSLGVPLEEKKNVEEAYISSLTSYNLEIIRGLDLYPPTRDVPKEKLIPLARKAGADSLLLLSVGARDVQQEYVPPTYHPGSSTSYVSGYGNYATVNTYHTPGYTSGGYNISKPSQAVFVTLFDTKKSKVVWEAEGVSGGNAFANFNDLSISAVKASIKELEKEGLVLKKEEAPVSPK